MTLHFLLFINYKCHVSQNNRQSHIQISCLSLVLSCAPSLFIISLSPSWAQMLRLIRLEKEASAACQLCAGLVGPRPSYGLGFCLSFLSGVTWSRRVFWPRVTLVQLSSLKMHRTGLGGFVRHFLCSRQDLFKRRLWNVVSSRNVSNTFYVNLHHCFI